MAAFNTLDGLDVDGKRVLVRVDFNVPMQDGRVTDATRIERGAVTLKELAGKRARVVVLSHFGRPKGKRETAMSLAPIAAALGEVLGDHNVAFASDCIGPPVQDAVEALKPSGVLLLENLRFHAGEEKNDAGFADQLAGLGDLYVNDAFSVSHRAHASVEALAHRLPAYAGRLLQAELEALATALGGAARPAAAIIGGAKVSTKLDVLGNLLDRVDALIIGGGMANTFLHAQGVGVGRSLCEKDLADTARAILAKAEAKNVRIVLPTDAVLARELREGAETRTCAIHQVRDDEMILDLGPESVASVNAQLGQSRTLLWNGPLGAFEIPPFDRATVEVARVAAELTRQGRLTTVGGGGDTVAALAHAGVEDDFSYVSTAGGAFLEWLEGKALPGIKALTPR